MKVPAPLKMVKPLALSLVTGLLSPVFADAGGSHALVQFTPHDRLFAVAFNGEFGETVGQDGLVLQSSDGGKTWLHEVNPPTPLALFSVAINGTRSIAVGQEGLILIRDGRKNWRKIQAVTDQRLLRVSVNKNGVAVAVGAFGTLVKSTDNGESWVLMKPDWAALYKSDDTNAFSTIHDEPTLYTVKVFDDGSIVIGGEYGQINRSTDGGTTWTSVFQAHAIKNGSIAPTVFGMNFRDDGTGYAAGQDGLLVMSADNGKSWNALDSHSQASLFDVNSTPDGHVFVVGQRAGLVSADAGKTWKPLKALDLTLNWYSGLAYSTSVADDSMIAVGHSGRVLKLAACSDSGCN